VRKIIDRKAKGEEITVEAAPERAEVVDLMAALEESVKAAKAGKPRKRTRKSA
jgi:non-homologous end joining protein Ku